MVKKVAKKASRAARKEDEYARLMAEKHGLPPPAPKPMALIEPDEVVEEQPYAEPFHIRPSGKGDDFPVLAKSVEPKPEKPGSRLTDHPSFADSFFCFICKSAACCAGTSPSWYVPPAWFCEECGVEAAKELRQMRNGKLNRIEDQAALKAGEAAGAFLDGLGETDLAKLAPRDYQNFCRRLVSSYISNAREIVRENYPPEE